MRNVMAALAALLVALPAAAQTQVVPYNGTSASSVSGALTTSGDTVTMPVSGTQWATVIWSVLGTAGTATGAVEVSNDGGNNYFAAPYSRRLIVPQNPAFISGGAGFTFITGTNFETAIPGNTTQFRIRCSGTGTTTTVQIQGGTPYTPNAPVIAKLYDVPVTAGANNNTPTFDVTGWRQVVVTVVVTTAATGAASLNIAEDEGAGTIPIGTSASIALGTYVFGWGDAGAFGTANPFTMVGGVTQLPLDRRFNVLVAGATTSAVRTRVVARR